MHRRTQLKRQFGAQFGLGYDPATPERKQREQQQEHLVEGMQRRLSFYDYEEVHPAKQLGYFIVRHLRKLPKEWHNYYHNLFRAEFAATRGVNKNWDQFCYVHDGYRKAKWILKKYGQEPTEGSVPEPYHSQWANASAEERAWAYRRSFHLKELQALQRETMDAFGSISRDRSQTIMSHISSTQPDPAKSQTGTNVHADDLPPPRESQIRDDLEMSEVYMMTIQDDKQWNPLLQKEKVGEAEFWGFEDEDDEDDFSPSAASAAKRKKKSDALREGKAAVKHQMNETNMTSEFHHDGESDNFIRKEKQQEDEFFKKYAVRPGGKVPGKNI